MLHVHRQIDRRLAKRFSMRRQVCVESKKRKEVPEEQMKTECAIRRFKGNRDGWKLNGTRQFWFMLMMLIYWEEAYIG